MNDQNMLTGYCDEYAPMSRNVMNYQMQSMPNLKTPLDKQRTQFEQSLLP